MKVLDRYLVRELLIPVVYATVSLVFLLLIADLFDNLDDLLNNKTPAAIIGQYYWSLVPQSFIQIIPWATWLGAIFLLVNLGFHSELLAMKAAGLKVTTIIRPILFSGFLIGIFTFLISDRIVPDASRKASELRVTYIEGKKDVTKEKAYKNVTYYSRDDLLSYFRTFWKHKKQVEGAVVLWLDSTQGSNRKKMIAKTGSWNGSAWEFKEVTEYHMDSRGGILGEPRTYAKKVYPDVNFSPSELATASSESTFLSYRELKNWTKKLEENGGTIQSEKVELQWRLSAPWQGLVMMIIVIPLLAKTSNRKLIAFNVLICVGLVFCYHVFGAVTIALGKAGKIFPFASAWAANILFVIGGLFYIEKANH